uniref:PPIase cyclophilin-type domain-containing protein n=1 Tax=Alexandrium catenella TaxID=2925 RepID=A0A7S1WY57_ALECA|mmetsp:Transcript_9912/g.26956  ORF Transcript_9912/g.26956 Transcript_9912/m.26956 type:complete len:323 (+) Transcript_9912:51-1019(+)
MATGDRANLGTASAGGAKSAPEETLYHIYVYGKYHDPLFQMYKVAAEWLARERRLVEATVEGYFETQYEQQLRYIIGKYAGSFVQSKPSAPLIFAETEDSILYFVNQKRFFDWAFKRFKYEDNTRLIFYKRIGIKALQAVKDATARSYCSIGIAVGNDPQEILQLELFDEECPVLSRNFLDLLALPSFKGHPVHRVKAGSWVQAGDLVDGSGLHSEAAGGGYLRHESFSIKHDRPGLLGMANHGKDTNGSQFYITLREMPFLDGRSVVFGRVISGMRTILKVSRMKTRNERPLEDVRVYYKEDSIVRGRIQVEASAKGAQAE